MNLYQNGVYLFEEQKVRAYPSNKGGLTLVEMITKVDDNAARTRNYVARYNNLEGIARIAKMFNDSKKAISDLLSKEEVINLMNVEIAKDTKFRVVDDNFKPVLDETGKETLFAAQTKTTYIVIDFDKNGYAILLPGVSTKLNKVVGKDEKKYLDSSLNYFCNAVVEQVSPERLQTVYLSQLPERQLSEEHKQHVSKYMYEISDTKDSFRRAFLPLLQTIVIHDPNEEGKTNAELRRAILNKQCFNPFFNSIITCLNKEAIPKKSRKCDIKALKGYIIETLSERSMQLINEDIERILNKFN